MTKSTKPQARKQFSTEWFNDLREGDDKELRAQLIQSAGPTLQLLSEIVKRRRDALERKYDYTDSWQFDLAKDVGRRQELDYLLKLLTPVLIKD